jgi:3-methyladenine DNA glycosylase AlkC
MEPFKNLISEEVVDLIGLHLGKSLNGFDRKAFVASIVPLLEELELKQRVQLISEKMLSVLPTNTEERNAILVGMLHPDTLTSARETSSEDGMCGWGVWPLTDVIGRSGLTAFDHSMEALREITMRGTSEFDVRPLIAADPDRALNIMLGWAKDDNEHVRRLATEGSRPRLPWGMRLHALVADPTKTLPILEVLRDDPSEYVRRSVANHLNDIAKDHPDLAANIARNWMTHASKYREKLIRHACRSLIKQGHSATLAVFGILPPAIGMPLIEINPRKVVLGGALTFDVTFSSTSAKPQKLIIDYVIHHRKANGTLAPKVFKWKQLTLSPNETLRETRRHPMRPITTRTYYSGDHAVSLRINGQDFGHAQFELEM